MSLTFGDDVVVIRVNFGSRRCDTRSAKTFGDFIQGSSDHQDGFIMGVSFSQIDEMRLD